MIRVGESAGPGRYGDRGHSDEGLEAGDGNPLLLLCSLCCRLSGRSRWPSAQSCYDAKAWGKAPELMAGGPVASSVEASSYNIFGILLLFILQVIWWALPA